MATQTKLSWNEIDPSTLAGPVASAYQTYKAVYAKAKDARAAFEKLAAATLELPSDKRLVISYNFGKLSMAIDDADTAPKASKKAVSFAALK